MQQRERLKSLNGVPLACICNSTKESVLALDSKNGNTLGADAISKLMGKVRVAFKVLPDGKSVPIGHQFV